MKNLKYIIGSAFFSLLALLSCNDEERSLETKGYLELGVTKNVEVITRGFEVEDQSLAVDICTGANDSIVKHFDDYNSMAGERVLLEVGTYKVKVSSNENEELDFEEPTFYGETKDVAITAGKTTPVSVECLLSCVKVTTEFTSPVKSKFKSCVARVSDKSGDHLDYSMTETRAGYFQPDYILVDLTVENKEGLTFKMSKLIENTEARDHYHLIFDLVESGENNSGMDFDISIETDPTNDEKHNVTIPLPETGYGQDAPEVQFVGANNEAITTLTFDKGDPQTLIAKISSENIGLNSVTLLATSSLFEEQGLPTTLNLLNLSEEDKTKLSAIGLDIQTLEDNKKPFDIDFSTMVSTRLPGGQHTFTIVARDEMGHETEAHTISITVNTEVNTHPVEIYEVWAHFATLRGYVKNATQDQATSYKFQYKKKKDGDDAWQDVEGSVTVGANGSSNVTQVVTNLEDNTEYEYRLVVDDNPAETMTFTTEEEIAIDNLSFDAWCTIGKSQYACSEENFDHKFWDSGNEGANTINSLNPTKEETSNVVKGSAARLTSTEVDAVIFKVFAAGSLYSGDFLEAVVGGISADKNGAKLSFGQPYTSRPTQLKGYYKYNPENVNYTSSKVPNVTSGQRDSCSIYIALTDWDAPFEVNTQTSTFVDFNSTNIIAYGELSKEEMSPESMANYKEFTIDLVYRDLTRKPTHILIVCSSSKYGDYFVGGVGSCLLIDELQLLYGDEPVVKQ